jgi:hypothetical protein
VVDPPPTEEQQGEFPSALVRPLPAAALLAASKPRTMGVPTPQAAQATKPQKAQEVAAVVDLQPVPDALDALHGRGLAPVDNPLWTLLDDVVRARRAAHRMRHRQVGNQASRVLKALVSESGMPALDPAADHTLEARHAVETTAEMPSGGAQEALHNSNFFALISAQRQRAMGYSDSDDEGDDDDDDDDDW